MEIEQALRVVAEKILGWEYQSSSVCAVPYYCAPPLEGLDDKRHINLFYLLTGNGRLELEIELIRSGYVLQQTHALEPFGPQCRVIKDHRQVAKVIDADTPQAALVLAASKLVEDMK